jgi:hypothetical protein
MTSCAAASFPIKDFNFIFETSKRARNAENFAENGAKKYALPAVYHGGINQDGVPTGLLGPAVRGRAPTGLAAARAVRKCRKECILAEALPKRPMANPTTAARTEQSGSGRAAAFR